MLVTKGYRVRIYPTAAQQEYFLRTIGACRWVYNHFLERKRDYYLDNKKTLSYGATSRELTLLRKEVTWLSEIQYQPLQQSLRQLDVAYSAFFNKSHRFPRFKSKKQPKQSFRKVIGWHVEGNKISVATGVLVRFRSRFPDKPNGTLVISRTTDGKWYASTTADVEVETPILSGAIGLDVGLKSLVITSGGDKFPCPPMMSIRAEHKALSRCVRGSKSSQKARSVLARKHKKIANIRKNHLHHISKAITSKNHAVVAVENLAVKNMMRNHKLARSIANASWSELLKQLRYKQEWQGGEVVAINRFFPSSKTCSSCHFVLDSLSLSTRSWRCPRCGTLHDRDVNAARVILQQAGERLGMEGGEGNRQPRLPMRMTRPTKFGYSNL